MPSGLDASSYGSAACPTAGIGISLSQYAHWMLRLCKLFASSPHTPRSPLPPFGNEERIQNTAHGSIVLPKTSVGVAYFNWNVVRVATCNWVKRHPQGSTCVKRVPQRAQESKRGCKGQPQHHHNAVAIRRGERKTRNKVFLLFTRRCSQKKLRVICFLCAQIPFL